MPRYVLTNRAVEDLSEIWEHTCTVWSESQADTYYLLMINAFDKIAETPAIGKSYKQIENTIRGLVAGKHIIFYRATQAGTIEIIRILHQRMDLKARLNE